MKDPGQILASVRSRLAGSWRDSLWDEAAQTAWPHRFPLGAVDTDDLTNRFPVVAEWVSGWRAWSAGNDVELADRVRRAGPTQQHIPSHLIVADIDAAARLAGGEWVERVQRARIRAARLRADFPDLSSGARVLGEVDSYTDQDFELLMKAGHWFAVNDVTGLTPRQVPIEGLHAKWLNTRQGTVATLARKPALGLTRNHPSRIHFTYLDPEYRSSGRRIHDSATVGDRFTPAYLPRVVVISENKDTAVNFPEVPGGVSVEGVGRGGSTIASFPWLAGAPIVIYWGDMDADGLEILNEFRAAGVPARSILMDSEAFDAWERFGVDTDARGSRIESRAERPVPWLTADERALYLRLIDPDWTRPRRIEQERIPLTVALALAHSTDAY